MSVQKCTGIFIWEFFVCGGHAEDTAAEREISGAETGEDEEMKRILITGAGSYIGTSFEKWLSQPQFAGMYQVDTVDMRGDGWREKDFHGYDTVFHVAGIAHADIGRVTNGQKKLYYAINCDLAVETAKKAKEAGVGQFIYMSSIIVYGEGTSVRKKRVITRETKPSPSNFYGDSKWKAEQRLQPLSDEAFHVAILRPPMIYGKGCKGNYRALEKIALHTPVFPDFPNERSVCYIDNLCECVRQIVERNDNGIFFPQNKKHIKTSDFIKEIAEFHRKKVLICKSFSPVILLFEKIPGKYGHMIKKAFGNLIYRTEEEKLPFTYQVIEWKHSIKMTEMK